MITYNVKRAEYRNGPYRVLARGLREKRFVDTGARNGRTYYYVVSAAGEGGEGLDSLQVKAKPAGGRR